MRPIQAFGPAFTVAALAASMATAQPYSIDTFTIDGGGGTLVGATYSLSGTIGQPDAGLLTGASFSIDGGFWPAAASDACNAADIAEPFGLLDLQDINSFITSFISNDLLADLTNDGILDLLDITTFVSAFLAGCP